jgi:hypothetical protein
MRLATVPMAWAAVMMLALLFAATPSVQALTNDQAPVGDFSGRIQLKAIVFSGVAPAAVSPAATSTSSDAVPPKPLPVEMVDVVTTSRGDHLTGTVVGIDPGGRLHMKSPEYASEVLVSGAAIESVVLRGADKDAGGDEVVLTSGDRITGTLSTITPDGVVIDSPVAGRLKIPSKVVRSIGRSGPEDILVETAFDTGRIEPWTNLVPQAWSLADGSLQCLGSFAERQPVYAKIDLAGPVTMVAKVEVLQGASLRFDLALFSDRLETEGRNCVTTAFMGNEIRLIEIIEGNATQFSQRNYGSAFTSGILRAAYDPAAGKVRVWMNDQDMGEYVLPVKLEKGQFVMFGSNVPLRVDYVRLMRGIVPPLGDEESRGAPADESIAVRLANGDHVAATKVSMVDGQFVLATSYGDIKCAPGQVSRMVFGRKSSATPARAKADVNVRTGGSRMTLQFDRLTADVLIGHSDAYGGEVRLRRTGIREIQFNVSK